MPTETNTQGAAPLPKPQIITNDPRLASMDLPGSKVSDSTSGEKSLIPGERISLPTRGLVYADNNPAKSGFITVRPITTKEEEILVTERYAKQGTTIDMLLSRCIVTKGINTLDLTSGDRVHILFYLRAISYGPEYKFKARMRDGSEQEITTDVGKLTIETLPDGFVEPWIIQVDGVTYEVRLLRGRDEQEITQERMRLKKKNPNAPEPSITLNLKKQIVSVNGSTDKDVISAHVDQLIPKNSHKLRSEIAKINPGPKLKITVTNENTGEDEEVVLAISETFFRADTE